jgi:Flp pilus assembly protein TadD
LAATVYELEECVAQVVGLLTKPSTATLRLRLDDGGALKEPVARALAGDLDGARAQLEALTREPMATAGAWHDLGVILEVQGRLDDARRAYAEAATRAPTEWMKAQALR